MRLAWLYNYIVMAYIVMACIVVAHVVMAYTVVAHIVVARHQDWGLEPPSLELSTSVMELATSCMSTALISS